MLLRARAEFEELESRGQESRAEPAGESITLEIASPTKEESGNWDILYPQTPLKVTTSVIGPVHTTFNGQANFN